MIDRSALLRSVDLATLADELLGPRTGTATSAHWRCPSPTHAQTGRTPPVSVFTSSSGDERWHCFGCGTGGTAIDLVLAARGGSVREAMQYLRGEGHRVIALPTARPSRQPDATGQRVLEAYVDRTAGILRSPAGARARGYLRHRGLQDDVLLANRVGADPGPAVLPRPAGLPRSGPGVVLPIIDRSNDHVLFAQLRLLAPRMSGPKYLNPTSQLAANPGAGIFLPSAGVPDDSPWLVCEGPIDALTAADAGYPAFGLLGAAASSRSAVDLIARAPGRLVIAFDADSAGSRGADRLKEMLIARHRSVATCHVPPGSNDLNGWRLDAGSRFHSELHRAIEIALTPHPRTPIRARSLSR